MSGKLTVSPIVRAFAVAQPFNSLVGVFGTLATANYYKKDGNNYQYSHYKDPIAIETRTPLQFEGKIVSQIIMESRFNAIRALNVDNTLIWLDKNDNIVGRTGTILSRHTLFPDEIVSDKRFMICNGRIYDGSFDNYCELRDVIAGTYINEIFVAFSPSTLVDVVNKRIIWVHPGCIVVDGGKYHGDTIQHVTSGRILTVGPINPQNGQAVHRWAEIGPRKIKNKKSNCIVCSDSADSKMMTYGCGHVVVCVECHEKLKPVDNIKKCPICQRAIMVAIPTIPR